jgi:arylformamidase
MIIHDISLTITPDMPTWPGDPHPELTSLARISDGELANVTHLSLSAHTGTHIDAPWHFLANGARLESIPLEILIGRVYVIEIPQVAIITANDLRSAEVPTGARRVLLKTRNGDFWEREENTFQTEFVAIAPDAAAWLVERGIQLIGIDYLSVAPFNDPQPTHQILLRAGIVIVEGLNLSQVTTGQYTLYCLPLKIDGIDGAPVRAILIEE